VFFSACRIDGYSYFRKANIYDHRIFSQSTIEKADKPYNFKFSPIDIHLELKRWMRPMLKKRERYKNFEQFLIAKQTVAFIVIRNDSVLYENYFNGANRDDQHGVFSITKSIIGLLTGIAYNDRVIKDLNEPIHHYLPAYSNDDRANITWYHLLNMTSGFNFSDYISFGKIIRMYYEDNLDDYIKRMNMKFAPGSEFIYKSFDSQVLGYCLEKATHRSVSELLEEKLWKKMGMEYDATWNTDRYLGRAKMFGGLNMRSIDLAKFGKLMINRGKWESEQLVSPYWVDECVSREQKAGKYFKYALGWWHLTRKTDGASKKAKDILAAGLRGQVLYIHPEKNIIIVRQGTDKADVDWDINMYRLAEMLCPTVVQ
jgi:CubicO group peptidase (beta-lactamase class C family)